MSASEGHKVLIACAFAGALVSQTASFASDKIGSDAASIHEITNAKTLHDVKAYYLLTLAQRYMRESPSSDADAHFEVPKYFRNGMDQSLWTSWAEKTVRDELLHTDDTITVSSHNKALARKAIDQAVSQAKQTTDDVTKLSTYFIGLQLCKKLGDDAGTQRCAALVRETTQSIETTSIPDESALTLASFILKSQAMVMIPVWIPEAKYVGELPKPAAPFSESTFKTAEELWQNAVRLVDRLDARNDTRRRRHRDLALWYLQLGKPELSLSEKQKLFKLVGFEDDGILFPQSGFCGHLLWWQKTIKQTIASACGMG